MPSYATPKLEFSPDPLSDTTPAYQDVTTYLISADWANGTQRDLDPPTAGAATFVLKNKNRDFEPDYSLGRFAGNILPLRRFRWSITADGVSRPQGTWYATSYTLSYPAGTDYSIVTVSCVDGFGLLSLLTLGFLSPPDATSYADVVMAQNPFAYYRMAESGGSTMTAEAGPEGRYFGASVVATNPVVGDSSPSRDFSTASSTSGYGASAKLDDVNIFSDPGQVSVTATFVSIGGNASILDGPLKSASPTFELQERSASVRDASNTPFSTPAASVPSAGPHHYALTYDGTLVSFYRDGALLGSISGGSGLAAPDANEKIYPSFANASVGTSLAHVAFFDYALSATQVAAQATAALNRGYNADTTGNRIATLATNALWSTAGITGGDVLNVAARMQSGQGTLEEINATASVEQPFGLFWFNDAGNPMYLGADYDTTTDTTLTDTAGGVPYTSIVTAFDDQLYNDVTVARDGGAGQHYTDTASQSDYLTRGYSQTGLIAETDADAALSASGILTIFSQPRQRVEQVSLNAATQAARTQILTREIGDVIRVKRMNATTEPIDVITRILGKSKHLDTSGDLSCTWSLARGFDASRAVWRLGQVAYGELNTGTKLG